MMIDPFHPLTAGFPSRPPQRRGLWDCAIARLVTLETRAPGTTLKPPPLFRAARAIHLWPTRCSIGSAHTPRCARLRRVSTTILASVDEEKMNPLSARLGVWCKKGAGVRESMSVMDSNLESSESSPGESGKGASDGRSYEEVPRSMGQTIRPVFLWRGSSTSRKRVVLKGMGKLALGHQDAPLDRPGDPGELISSNQERCWQHAGQAARGPAPPCSRRGREPTAEPVSGSRDRRCWRRSWRPARA